MDDLTGGARGERATGTPNTIYDLSSVLFHALEGGASYDTYIEDAEREGDHELTEFFRRVREEDRDRAAEARLLLAERTRATTAGVGVEPVEGDTPPSEGLTAGGAPPPRTSGVEEGVLPGREGRTEGTPPREGALTGDAPAGDASPGDASRRTEGDGPLGRGDDRQAEGERKEDKGLLDRARDAILGEEETPRRREGTERPEERR
jgi:hypothetical protein